MKNFKTKLDLLCSKIAKKALDYTEIEDKVPIIETKIFFLGLTLYPNINSIWNYDILYLYKGLQEKGIEARIHDPYIRSSESISYGICLGRHSSDENLTHSYDMLILSTPHEWYIQNLTKISHLLKPNRPTIFLDLYGVFTRLHSIGDYIEIVNFREETEKAELMGGLNRPLLSRH